MSSSQSTVGECRSPRLRRHASNRWKPVFTRTWFRIGFCVAVLASVCSGTISFSGQNQATIDEESPNGTLVTTLLVDDLSGLVVTLTLQRSDDYALFSIDGTGALRVAGRLDREAREVYRCTVVGRNTNGDESTYSVQVNVRDINDNAPMFPQASSTVSILEDAAVGSVVFAARATDADQVVRVEQFRTNPLTGLQEPNGFIYTISNGLISYSIAAGNNNGTFHIDRDSGNVTLNATLPGRTQYTLLLNATDPDGLHGTTAVTIRVGDANDNSPVFYEPQPFTLTLSENTAIGYEILSGAYANDTDFGTNALITLVLASGNEGGEFAINSTTGRITLVKQLDRETRPMIDLVLAAQDGGKPQLQDTVTITINITDVNDNAPRFQQPSYAESVLESASPGSTVAMVRALDPDAPGNASLVRYSFVPGQDGGGVFTLDVASGKITLGQNLDRETISSYFLQIQASDQDEILANRMTSVVNLTVSVSDVNDNVPRFTKDLFVGGLASDATINAATVRLNATDLDANPQLTYSLVSDLAGSFTVDTVTGLITSLLPSVDYSAQRFYNMTARVSDAGGRSSTASVIIEVHEANPSAPVFSPVVYQASINESLPVGTSILRVTATDADLRQVGEVSYDIVPNGGDFGMAGSLSVDSVTGILSVASSLDRDTMDTLVFRIRAKDKGFPTPKSDFANITIILLDVNDVAPIFEPDMVTRLLENLPNVSTPIFRVNATDPDSGLGGVFTYGLAAGDWPSGLFSVDPVLGNISINFGVDREAQSQFTVTVVATDQGTPSLSRSGNLTVFVDDINDSPPYFLTDYNADVLENETVGAPVARVSALDDDIGVNAISTYSVTSGNDLRHFMINSSSGVVFIASNLDRESVDLYSLTITATDAAGWMATTTLNISVLDVNDNTPHFALPLLSYNVSESQQVSTTLFTLVASDADIGNILSYNLSNAADDVPALSYLNISSLGGEVTLIQELDREAIAQVHAIVWVTDGLFVSNATLVVTLLDYNDVTPAFEQPIYTVTVSENVTVPTSLLTVSASDNDTDAVNKEITYVLLSGNGLNWFSIDAASGEISVSASLDRETLELVNLTVGAVNLAAPTLTGETSVLITLADVNDSPPSFGLMPPVLRAREGSQFTSVGYLNASDPDIMQNTITYTLITDNVGNGLRFNSSTGEVSVVGELDYERQSQYFIVVRADDQGNPPQGTTVNATFLILDINDNTPVFSKAMFSTSVSEDAANGTSVALPLASDRDATSNGALTYSLTPASFPFSINQSSGLVTVSRMLDRETIDFYNMTVTVSDAGIPPRVASAPLEITITDVNDSPPKFDNASYSAMLQENMAPGTIVVRVQASDPDIGANSEITYNISAGNMARRFDISPNSGVIFTTMSLDHEEQSSYILIVTALNSAATPPDSDVVTVTVTVTDLNDNRPVIIDNSASQLKVPESTQAGSAIGVVPYRDGDSGVFGKVTFSIVGTSSLFSLNSTTGMLYLTGFLDYETRIHYAIQVHLEDGGSPALIGDGSVFIEVVDSNDNAPRFLTDRFIQTVSSTALQGDTALKIQAYDSDVGTNAQISYNATGGNGTSSFEVVVPVGTSEAEIRLTRHAAGLGLETFELLVDVTDGLHRSQVTIVLHIQDLSQGRSFASSLLRATVTDTSIAPGQALVFSILGTGIYTVSVYPSTFTAFTVSQPKSEIQINTPLNAATTPNYHFMLRLDDDTTNSAHFVQVRIVISPSRNYYPPVLPSSFFVREVAEGIYQVGSSALLTTIAATDRDTPVRSNAQRVIHTSLDQATFNYDTAGCLRVIKSVDYDNGQRNYSKQLVARNNLHSNRLQDTASLMIIVTEANDNTPLFSLPAYTVVLLENATVSPMPILTVTATDSDVGTSGDLSYGLLDDVQAGGGNFDHVTFQVNSATGEIRLAQSLDREQDHEYQLVLVAQDGGNPGRSARVPINIRILDINDNFPIFQQKSYPIELHENTTIGTLIVHTNATDKDLVQLSQSSSASDVLNGLVRYSIVDGNAAGRFSVNQTTGEVTLIAALDRETTDAYDVIIRAMDGGGLHTDVHMLVTVLDNNDNAPIFLSQQYNASISEDAPPGVDLVQVEANDTDYLGLHSTVRYSIIGGNPMSVFQMNATNGWVSTAGSLDRETLSLYNLTVEVNDLGVPQLSSTGHVLISIIDVNEFPPVFSSLPYSTPVVENVSVMTSVFQVSSTDRDFGVNATAVYSLVAGNVDDAFAVNSSTGVVSIAKALDYELLTSYNLTVLAQDSAPDGYRLNASTNLEILVQDSNDNAPIFSELLYTSTVSEDALVGSTVLNITASDRDSPARFGIVTYSLVSGTANALRTFNINSTSGLVISTSNFNREVFPMYNITARATDGGGRHRDVALQILIADVNDNAPVFPNVTLRASITEGLPNSSYVTQLVATDADIGENADLRYSIVFPVSSTNCEQLCPHLISSCGNQFLQSRVIPLSSYFVINSSTGVVRSSRVLDREAVSNFVLQVVATDNSTKQPQLNGTSCLMIDISDVNDNDPVFPVAEYNVRIAENLPPQTALVTVQATDADSSLFGPVTYSLDGSVASRLFSINTTSGEIRSNSSYDREVMSVWRFSVLARDNGNRVTSVPLVVNVTDVNDNSPRFVFRNISDTEYNQNVSENTSVGSPFLQVRVLDADEGSNADVFFSTNTSAAASTPFNVTSSGYIVVALPLDRETQLTYVITVSAHDRGVPSLVTHATVRITVTDINDNKPVFTNATYQFVINENDNASTFSVTAHDQDEEGDTAVQYFLQSDQPFLTSPPVGINSSTGVIFLRQALDAEIKTYYSFNVTAADGELTDSSTLSSTAQVEVFVDDVNDIAPRFDSPLYQFAVREGGVASRMVFTVTAIDHDLTSPNNEIRYAIASPTASPFVINSSSGEVEISQTLDRETQNLYSLSIVAIDEGFPSLSSNTTVTVFVLDANDHVPVFERLQYTFRIFENENSGLLVGNVTASDADQGNVSYAILNDTSVDGFVIDATSGVISTNRSLDREYNHTVVLFVFASDGLPVRSNLSVTEVTVVLLDRNDNPPLFIRPELFFVSISEGSSVGSTVLLTTAGDADVGVNARLTFSLSAGDSGMFSVNSSTGEISLAMALDFETRQYLTFQLTVKDSGMPSLSSTTTVNITVVDDNDNIPVFVSPYFAVIPENTLSTWQLQVNATDDDSTSNAALSFMISGGNTDSDFQIDSITGLVTINNSLDYERTPEYNLTLLVQDAGRKVLNSTIFFQVTVVDLNDNTPIFRPSALNVSVTEVTPLYQTIATIVATDADSTSNSKLRYFISAGNSLGHFTIIESEGRLITLSVLDRERQSQYGLTVTAEDHGTPTRFSTAQITVYVGDVNDDRPRAAARELSTTVSSSIPSGSAVYEISARDRDIGRNGQVQYTVTDGNDGGLFAIAAQSNVVTTTRRIVDTDKVYQLSLSITDQGVPSLQDSVILTVSISRNNTQGPMFVAPSQRTTISASTIVGADVAFAYAADSIIPRGSSGIAYSFDTGIDLTTFPFSVGLRSGAVSVRSSLAAYEGTEVIPNVCASDGQFSNCQPVNISVRSPTATAFSQPSYTFTVLESLSLGTIVGAVTMSSASLYSIELGNNASIFVIATNGSITTAASLDFETQQQHILTVSGSGVFGSSRVIVRIIVSDVNEYPPVFASDVYHVVVPEDTFPMSSIVTLTATDQDLSSLNTATRCSIVSGNDKQWFRLSDTNFESCSLMTTTLVDREESAVIMLNVSVANYASSSPFVSYASVVITISDANDNSPVFDAGSYVTSIADGATRGDVVIYLNATDRDVGYNGEVFYAIKHSTQLSLFAINSSSGALIVQQPLNSSAISSVNLVVQAGDFGSPASQSSSVNVLVRITATNRHAPLFSQSEVAVTVHETTRVPFTVGTFTATDVDGPDDQIRYSLVGVDSPLFDVDVNSGALVLLQPLNYSSAMNLSVVIVAMDQGNPGLSSNITINVAVTDENNHDPLFLDIQYVFRVPELSPVDFTVVQITATDPDASMLTYGISVNAVSPSGSDIFKINSTSGVLSLSDTLDHESRKSYGIEVVVFDHGYQHRRSTRQSVAVLVVDENDNYPVFVSVPSRLNLSRFLTDGFDVDRVVATDADEFFGNVTYALLTENTDEILVIDQKTGTLTVSRQPGTLAASEYNATVSASDGELSVNHTVEVYYDFYGNFCISTVCYLTQPSTGCSMNDTAPCQLCPAEWLPILDNQACTSMYCPTPTDWVCAKTNSTNGTCIPLQQPCEGQRCDKSHSLCQPTGRCLPLSTPTTCDNSSTTCLVDQALVERDLSRRTCEDASRLSLTGRSCTQMDTVYCALRDRCINVNVPNPCVQCRPPLLECPRTGVCTLDRGECCNSSDMVYCNYTKSCLHNSVPCVLITTEPPSVTPTPNIAPILNTDALFVGEVRRDSFVNLDNEQIVQDGIHLGDLLANGTGEPFANDSNADILGIAVVNISSFAGSWWQYAECSDPMSLSCTVSPSSWIDFPRNIPNGRAFLISANTRIRPVVTGGTHGAVWFEAHAYDGSTDGLQNFAGNGSIDSTGMVVGVDGVGGVSAFSSGTVYIFSVVQPAVEYPSFNDGADLPLVNLPEDTPSHLNDGTSVLDLLSRPILTRLYTVDDTTIVNLPVDEALLSSFGNFSDYYTQVALVNSLVSDRNSASQVGSQPGLIVEFQLPDTAGRWQISPRGTLQTWYYVDRLLSGSGNISVFVDQRARLRFLPAPDFYGSPLSLRARAWDGVTRASPGPLGVTAVLTSDLAANVLPTSMSPEWQSVGFSVLNVADRVTNTSASLVLNAIPYRIRYEYNRIFAVDVQRPIDNLRMNIGAFSTAMLLSLLRTISVLRAEPLSSTSSEVLFEVEGNTHTKDDIIAGIYGHRLPLSALNFNITAVRDYALFGRGASCSIPSPALHQSNDGTLVGDIAVQGADDADGTPVGLAVVGQRVTPLGIWQYLRRDINSMDGETLLQNATRRYADGSAASAATARLLETARRTNVSRSNIWLSFPPSLSSRSAFLLHAHDRIRFSPNPDTYWTVQSADVPQLQVKFWDILMGGQPGQYNVDTECYVRTTNSSFAPPCFAFSDHQLVITALRFGCDGVAGSGLVHDACCQCGGKGSSCGTSCNGQSNKVFDSCNECGGVGLSCLGCDKVPFSRNTADDCGVCQGNSTSRDCNMVCFGAAVQDECGLCTEGNTGRQYNEDMDCAGVCFGNATVDTCGDCTGGNTTLAVDYRRDCTGQCGGLFRRDPACGVCRSLSANTGMTDYRDCEGMCFGSSRLDSCGTCYNTTTSANARLDVCGVCGGGGTTCAGCDATPASGRVVDRCGVCNGNNCGCLRIFDFQPRSGPLSGGTRIRIEGAGFFVNHTGSSGFDSMGNALPNCGGIVESQVSGGNVRALCRFRGQTGQFLGSGMTRFLSQSQMNCFTPLSQVPQAGLYKVTVNVNGGPFSVKEDVDATFLFVDTSNSRTNSLSPIQTLTTTPVTVTLSGKNYSPSRDVRCLLTNMTSCGSTDINEDGHLLLVPTFMNTTHIQCLMPAVKTSCRISVHVSIDGQTSGMIQLGAGASALFTYAFPQPKMLSARFTASLTSLRVVWDQMIYLSTGFLTSCSKLFTEVALLGGDEAMCRWESDTQDAVIITPHATGNITLNSRLATVDGVVNTRAQSFPDASRGDVITVTSSAPLVRPTASISGPIDVPSCGAVSLQGYAMGAVGYRSPRYVWTVAVQDGETAQLVRLQDSAALQSPAMQQLELDSSLFELAVDYYVHLTVVNSLGTVSLPARHLLRRTASAPAVSVRISGPPAESLTEGLKLFYSETTPASCASVSNSTVSWDLWQVSDTPGEGNRLVQNGSSTTFLAELTGSRRYILEATSAVSYMLSGVAMHGTYSARKSINVLNAELRVVIRGTRTVTTTDGFSLTALLVHDAQNLAAATYQWLCLDGTILCEDSPNVVSFQLSRSSVQLVPANTLQPGRAYTFIVKVVAGSRTANGTIDVEAASTRVPDITVLSDIVPAPVSSDKIVINAWVTSSRSIVSMMWESVAGTGISTFNLGNAGSLLMANSTYVPNGLRTIIRNVTVTPNVPQNVPLVLAPGVLVGGARYRIDITVSDGVSTGLSYNSFVPDGPPSAGSLLVRPATGDEDTLFSLAARDWRNAVSNGELEYRFGLEGVLGRKTWLTAWTTKSETVTRLPSSLSSRPLPILLQVRGTRGAVAERRQNVTVSSTAAATTSVLSASLLRAQAAHSDRSDGPAAMQDLVVLATQAVHRSASAADLDIILDGSAQLARKILANTPSEASSLEYARTSISELAAMTSSAGATLPDTSSAALLESLAMTMASELVLPGLAQLPSGTDSPASLTQPSLSPNALDGNISAIQSQDLMETMASIVRYSTPSRQEASFVAMRQTSMRIASSLCRNLAVEERSVLLFDAGFTSTIEHIYPSESLCSGSSCIKLGSDLYSLFLSWQCGQADGTPCQGVCVTRTNYNSGILSSSNSISAADLDSVSLAMVNTKYPGRNLSEITVHSQLYSFSLMHPVSGMEFIVDNQTQKINVTLPLSTVNTSLPLLCAHRSTSSLQWTVDDGEPPRIIATSGTQQHAVCSYTHLTQFAVIVLPPLLPTTIPPPTTTPMATVPLPTQTPTPITTTPLTVPTRVITTTPPATTSSIPPESNTAAIVIGIVVAVVVTLALILAFTIYRQKRYAKKVTIDNTDGCVMSTERIRMRPQTATSSEQGIIKIVVLDTDNSRRPAGSVVIDRTTRLRELRNQLLEMDLKTYYFLSEDLTIIKPADELHMVVNTVYKDTAFLRRISLGSTGPMDAGMDDIHLHFCRCGSVANFECTSCSAIGYCSDDCQLADWKAEHEADCHRLAEVVQRRKILQQGSRRTSLVVGNPSDHVPVMSRNPSRTNGFSPSRTDSWSQFVRQQPSSRSLLSTTSPAVTAAAGDVFFGETHEADPNSIPDPPKTPSINNTSPGIPDNSSSNLSGVSPVASPGPVNIFPSIGDGAVLANSGVVETSLSLPGKSRKKTHRAKQAAAAGNANDTGTPGKQKDQLANKSADGLGRLRVKSGARKSIDPVISEQEHPKRTEPEKATSKITKPPFQVPRHTSTSSLFSTDRSAAASNSITYAPLDSAGLSPTQGTSPTDNAPAGTFRSRASMSSMHAASSNSASLVPVELADVSSSPATSSAEATPKKSMKKRGSISSIASSITGALSRSGKVNPAPMSSEAERESPFRPGNAVGRRTSLGREQDTGDDASVLPPQPVQSRPSSNQEPRATGVAAQGGTRPRGFGRASSRGLSVRSFTGSELGMEVDDGPKTLGQRELNTLEEEFRAENDDPELV